ncbi:MAG: galactose-1-phosphate uridylyltransferase [Bacteroidota bacterium]
MSERSIRRDPLTGDWVIIAPERGRRPGARPGRSVDDRDRARHRCPFCPEHEDELAHILLETSSPDHPAGWATRVVDNKYPAVSADRARLLRNGLYATMSAGGRHEVIIETPDHRRDFADAQTSELTTIVETYAARMESIRRERPDLHPVLFKNHGPRAGASLRHPHSQLIGVPVVPQAVRNRERRSRAYFNRSGRCLLCAVLSREVKHGRRVVYEDDHFLAAVPFAASAPYELLLIPKRHLADLSDITSEEVGGLALHFQILSRILRSQLYDPDLNVLFMTPSPSYLRHPSSHWYVLIRPRFGTDAGFERATGMRINASRPEDDARLIRSAARTAR